MLVNLLRIISEEICIEVRLNGLEVVFVCEVQGLVFDSCFQGRGFSLVSCPVLRRSGFPVLPGFQRLSNFDRFVIAVKFSSLHNPYWEIILTNQLLKWLFYSILLISTRAIQHHELLLVHVISKQLIESLGERLNNRI